MKRGSSDILRAAIIALGLFVLALCIFVFPYTVSSGVKEFPNASGVLTLATVILYLSTIPFYTALTQAFKLLGLIDKNKAFSGASIRTLKLIKYCALSMSILYVGLMPLFYSVAQDDDAPGLIIFGMVVIFTPSIIATSAAVLQKLLQNAVNIKSENDLTV